jgi:hypothetical protein
MTKRRCKQNACAFVSFSTLLLLQRTGLSAKKLEIQVAACDRRVAIRSRRALSIDVTGAEALIYISTNRVSPESRLEAAKASRAFVATEFKGRSDGKAAAIQTALTFSAITIDTATCRRPADLLTFAAPIAGTTVPSGGHARPSRQVDGLTASGFLDTTGCRARIAGIWTDDRCPRSSATQGPIADATRHAGLSVVTRRAGRDRQLHTVSGLTGAVAAVPILIDAVIIGAAFHPQEITMARMEIHLLLRNGHRLIRRVRIPRRVADGQIAGTRPAMRSRHRAGNEARRSSGNAPQHSSAREALTKRTREVIELRSVHTLLPNSRIV